MGYRKIVLANSLSYTVEKDASANFFLFLKYIIVVAYTMRKCLSSCIFRIIP